MKNIFGTTEELRLTDENGVVRYKYTNKHTRSTQSTYNSIGNKLKFEDSDGDWYKCTYNSNGRRLTYKDSDGYWDKSTYDSNGNQLTFENSNGYWRKHTYDSSGNELTYENSKGEKRSFGGQVTTIEELINKLGHNFKIKK